MKLYLEIDVKQTGAGAAPVIRGVRQLGAEAAGATRAVDAMNRRMADGWADGTRRLVQYTAAYFGLRAAIGGVQSLLQTGFDFNAKLESSRLGLAAIIAQVGDLSDGNGKLFRGVEKFNVAQTLAIQLQKDLLRDARESAASYEQLLSGMQTALPIAISRGFSLDQMREFVMLASQAASAIDPALLTEGQFSQEMRGLLEGDLSRMSRLARTVFADFEGGAEGLKKKMAELQKEGKLFDFMRERLGQFGEAGKRSMNTLTVSISNFKDAWQQALGEGTQGQMRGLTKLIQDATAKIIVFDEKGNATFNEDFISSVERLAGAFFGLAENVAKAAEALPALLNYLSNLLQPDMQKVLMAISGAAIGTAVGHPLAGAALGYAYGGVMGRNPLVNANAEAPDTSPERRANLANKLLLLTKGTPFQDQLKGIGRTNLGQVAEAYYGAGNVPEGERLKLLVDMLAKGRVEADAFRKALEPLVGRFAPKKDGVTLKAPPTGPDEDEKKEREKALKLLQQTNLEQDRANELARMDLAILREKDPIRRAELETLKEVIEETFKLSTLESQLRAQPGAKESEIQAAMEAARATSDVRMAITIEGERKTIEAVRQEQITAAAEMGAQVAEIMTGVADEYTETWKANADRRFAIENALALKLERTYADLGEKFKGATRELLLTGIEGGSLVESFDRILQQLQQSWADFLGSSFDAYWEKLSLMAQGKKVDPDTGAMVAASPQEQSRAQWGMAGIQGAGALYGLYQGGQSGASRGSLVASGALSGAAIGTQIAPGIGTFIGALIGGIAGALMPSGVKESRYDVQVMPDGTVRILGSGDGLKPEDVRKAERDLSRSILNTRKQIRGILDILPARLLEGVSLDGVGELDIRETIKGKESVPRRLAAFIATTIPEALIDTFEPIFEAAFDALGVSEQRFAELRARMKDMEPTEALSFLRSYAEVVVGFDEAMRFLTLDTGGKLGRARDVLGATPLQQIDQLTSKIGTLGETFDMLTLDEQVDRATEILALTDQRYQLELQYLRQIEDTMESINKAIEAQIFDIEMTQLSPEQQADKLLERLRSIRTDLATASTPEQVAQLIGEGQQVTQRLFELLGRTPEAAAQSIDLLNDLRNVSNDRLKQLIDEVHANDEKLLNTVERIFEWLTRTDADRERGRLVTRPEDPGGGPVRDDPELGKIIVFADALATRGTPAVDAFTTAVEGATARLATLDPGAFTFNVIVDGDVGAVVERVTVEATNRVTGQVVRHVAQAQRRAKPL